MQYDHYLNPVWLLVELPGDDEDVVTVTTDDDLDDVEVLWTSTNPVLFILLFELFVNDDVECCFKNSHKSPPTNPSPGSTHSLTTQTGSPWLQAANTRATFGWFGRSHELRISDMNDWLKENKQQIIINCVRNAYTS